MTSKFYIKEVIDIDKKNEIISSKIQPNFIHNRFDIIYKNDYHLFCIFDNNGAKYYVPVKIIKYSAFLAVQLMYIESEALQTLSKYLFERFFIWKIKYKFLLNNFTNSKDRYYFIVNLPNDIDTFNKNLSNNTRYNVSRYCKRIEKDFVYSVKHFSGNEIINNNIYEIYCRFKKVTHNYNNKEKPEDYIKNNFITDAFVMYLNDNITSIVFLNILNDTAFLENLTYDIKYKNYSIGTILYYNTIKELINRKIKTLYLYVGTGEYKMRFNGTKIKCYNGTIYRYRIFNFIRRLFTKK